MSWSELIGHKGDILWWEMSIRAVLIFIFGLVLIRFFGRRAFGKQNPSTSSSRSLSDPASAAP